VVVSVEDGCLKCKRDPSRLVAGAKPLTCACDLGLTTPVACVAPGVGITAKLGLGAIEKIKEIQKKIDALQRIAHTMKARSRRNLRHGRLDRLYKQLANVVHDMHLKMVHWLCKNFDVILWPQFATGNMLLKSKPGGRKLSSAGARCLQALSFAKLKAILFLKAKEYGIQVFEVSEAYTTQFCICGNRQMHELNERKLICQECRLLNIDRDIRSAYSIYLRFLTTVNELAIKYNQPTFDFELRREPCTLNETRVSSKNSF